MPSVNPRRPIENVAPDGLEADVPLSDRFVRLAQASDALAWPEGVTRAMAELKAATDRVTGLMAQVSGNAGSIGDLAAAVDSDVIAEGAVEAPPAVDRSDPTSSDFKDLVQRVSCEIDAYTIPGQPPEAFGEALRPKWLVGRLSEMRAALVEPYVLDVADGRDRRTASRRPVVIVASDADRALLAFDPDPQGDFVVVWRRPNDDVLSNIRGGAVECFLAT